jgi:hypothetical protein
MKTKLLLTLLAALTLHGCKEVTRAEWLTYNLDRCILAGGESKASPDRTHFSCWRGTRSLFSEYYQIDS